MGEEFSEVMKSKDPKYKYNFKYQLKRLIK